jgi:L-seryl-tRNA(Ser) seleniumtransferase
MQAEFRKLPAVDTLLRLPQIAALAQQHGQAAIAALIRDLVEEQRAAIRAGAPAPDPQSWPNRVDAAVARWAAPSLLPVINATGVIIHTNLGRAPLSLAARRAVDAVAAGYSNLEYDLRAGARGGRHDHARTRLARVCGAEDALIVNNNAAALFLVLTALCAGREVLISRGQLVEIGGGFRIPDVMRQSGAHLVEVGTTNRTHLQDFRAALGERTAAILRVHSSNFKQIGFVTEPALADLAQLTVYAQRAGNELADASAIDSGLSNTANGDRSNRQTHGTSVILIDDLGSGTLLDTAAYGLAPEPMVQASIAAGADVVTFSGDKLLGGPQAGIIVGRRAYIERLRNHPLARALRVDKMTLAALEATLATYEQGRAEAEIPVWQMIAAPVDALRARVTAWRDALFQESEQARGLETAIWETQSAIGGGSLPGETLPSVGLALQVPDPEALAACLREPCLRKPCSSELQAQEQVVPLVGRMQNDHLVLDARTVLPEQDALVPILLRRALAQVAQG